MQKTPNLGLNKPDYTDIADIADLNENMNILDEHILSKINGGTVLGTFVFYKVLRTEDGIVRDYYKTTISPELIQILKHSDDNGEYYIKITDLGITIDYNNGETQTIITRGNLKVTADNKTAESYLTGKYIVENNTKLEDKYAPKEHTHTLSEVLGNDAENGVVPVENGGTGADTKEGARNNLGLSTVASSGDYNDLKNKPTSLPAKGILLLDIDMSTYKTPVEQPNGIYNDLIYAYPQAVTEAEQAITGRSGYWYYLTVNNQTLKVPYAEKAIQALSLGTDAVSADTGIVRNVDGISDSVMNDPLYPVSYVTRTSASPYSPVNGVECHLMYFPSTGSYGTQLAIVEQAFKGNVNDDISTDIVRGLNIYLRSGQKRVALDDSKDTGDFNDLGYICTVNVNPKDKDTCKYIAADWSEWVKINTDEFIEYTGVNSVISSYNSYSMTLNLFGSNISDVIGEIFNFVADAYVKSTKVGTDLAAHLNTGSGKHTSAQISTEAFTTDSFAINGSLYNYSYNNTSIETLIKTVANRVELIRGYITEHYKDNYGGLKHLPANGAWNNTLIYNSAGTAAWAPSPYTYRKLSSVSLTYNNWYKVALCNFTSLDKFGGGSAKISIHAYDGTGKEQTLVCRANYIGGNEDLINKCTLEVITCIYRGAKLFDKVSQVSLNTGFIALCAAASVSSLTINITVDSTISEDRADIKANDSVWDLSLTDDYEGNWIWTHNGQHYWVDYDI